MANVVISRILDLEASGHFFDFDMIKHADEIIAAMRKNMFSQEQLRLIIRKTYGNLTDESLDIITAMSANKLTDFSFVAQGVTFTLNSTYYWAITQAILQRYLRHLIRHAEHGTISINNELMTEIENNTLIPSPNAVAIMHNCEASNPIHKYRQIHFIKMLAHIPTEFDSALSELRKCYAPDGQAAIETLNVIQQQQQTEVQP